MPEAARVVRANRGLRRADRLLLNLEVGPDLVAERTREVQGSKGAWSWIGSISGEPDSEVIFAGRGEAVSGTIRYQGRLFKLQPIGQGKQLLLEVSPNEPFDEMDPVPVPALSVGDELNGQSGGGAVSTQGDTQTTVDVMVLYTPSARTRYGGADGVEALIALAVEETNQAYQNSNVSARLRLVHTAEVAYTETGNMSTDLSSLKGKSDGVMDEVHALRDAHGADLVSLIVASGGYCGIAYQISNLASFYASYGFSVVYHSCATGYYSFGHELGHNMGSAHDNANATNGLYDYSFGFQHTGGAFRTIMAYDCPGGCARVQHFSNPYVNYAGSPTGVADWADNALSLSDASPTISTWRESVSSITLPAAPSGLGAVALSHEEIDLAWADNSSDESGFRIERSDNGVDYREIASLGAGTTGYADSGLIPEATYYYRVSAFNGTGSSGYSNEAWAITDAAPAPPPAQPPAAPSGLAAAASSQSAISLGWTDNADNETRFEVERSSNGGVDWRLIATLGVSSKGYLDQGLTPDTTFGYRVRAIGDGGASDYSNIANATTEPAPVTGCSVQGASNLTLYSRSIKWRLTNDGGTTLTVDRIEIGWPSAQGNLKKIRLDGDHLWHGNVAPSASATVLDLGGGSGTRIAPGTSRVLMFYFSRRYTGDTQGDYEIDVQFAEGCSVQL